MPIGGKGRSVPSMLPRADVITFRLNVRAAESPSEGSGVGRLNKAPPNKLLLLTPLPASAPAFDTAQAVEVVNSVRL
jgi:hypothetical protein